MNLLIRKTLCKMWQSLVTFANPQQCHIDIIRHALYRVTHQVVTNLLLTSKQKFRFGLPCPGLARPKRNFCFEVNGSFIATWYVYLYYQVCFTLLCPEHWKVCSSRSYLKSPDPRICFSQREEESRGDARQPRDALAEREDGPPAPAVHRHQAEDVAW